MRILLALQRHLVVIRGGLKDGIWVLLGLIAALLLIFCNVLILVGLFAGIAKVWP